MLDYGNITIEFDDKNIIDNLFVNYYPKRKICFI